VLALAELQMVRTNDRLTTLFLLDFSQSVPREYQEYMVGLAQESSRRQRRSDDLAGLIVFGKTPRVEVPPGPSDLGVGSPENPVDGEYTDLGGAIKLALATFPEETAR